MEPKNIKPIPKSIESKIRRLDKKDCPAQKGLRFYAYLTTLDKELVKITVAMRNNRRGEQFIKQVAVHGVYSDNCLVRDLEYCYLGICAYRVGWYDEGIHTTRPYYNDGKWYPTPFKYYNPFAKVVNVGYAVKQPDFKYSMADKYDCACIITYLRTYLEYPQTEYLIKLGLGKFAQSKVILKKVGTDKKFAKWLISNKNTLANNYYYSNAIVNTYRHGTSLEQEQAKQRLKIELRQNNFEDFKRTFGKGFEQLCQYITDKATSLSNYQDYYNACTYLHLDMEQPKNRFPHDFKRWHDIRIDEYATAKALADKEEREHLYEKFAAVAEKYLPLEYDKQSVFVVIIPHSPADLVREGNILNHCVGRMNYDQRMIREDSLIFFIRNKADIETPLVTVEYSPKSKQILQCYGESDTRPNAKIMNFVNKKWLPYANQQLQQIAA
ncbi:MAG: PcfJ domain-containing protein [Clostridia bacterium]|nr:PcfJ domain-containing protein [Clostridia bacterium]